MKTIKTFTHLLLVDETAEIQEGDWFINTSSQTVHKSDGTEIFDYRKDKQVNFKIIAASPKLEDLPEFETLPPNTEDDVEELAYNELDSEATVGVTTKGESQMFIQGYFKGYNQAKSERMFSLDDMKKAMFEVYKNGIRNPKDGKESFSEISDRVIQSLTKPKEYEFVPEMEKETLYTTDGLDYKGDLQPKIVNNKIYGKWKQKN